MNNCPETDRGVTATLRRIASLSVCGAIFVGGPAVGQGDAAGEEEIEEIVVFADSARTGTKTDTDLMKIPQSVSVVTADQFKQQGAVNFQDIFRYSAGVSTETNGIDTRGDFFSARGFATVQYLDGLNRMPDFVYGARMEVFTLERAEILRGPSAVLYGAGGAGGLFNAVSKTPKHGFGGEFGVGVGTDRRKQVQLDVTGGLTDTVAARFVGLLREGRLQPEYQDDNRSLVMPSVSWSPTPATDITLLTLYQKDDMGTQTYLPLSKSADAPSDAERLPIDFFVGEPGFNHMDMDHISGSMLIDHRFNENAALGSRTRFFDQTVDYAEVYGDLSDGVDPFIDPERTLLAREFYVLDEAYQVLNSDNHVRFDFDTGPFAHTVLVGADYTRFRQDRREGFSCDGFEGLFGCFEGGSPPPLDVTDPQYGMPFDYDFTNSYTTESTQFGVYLQDQIDYGDRVSLIFGVRRDRATSEVSGVEEEPNTATTLRGGIIIDVGAGLSPYAGYSESFLPVFGGDFYGNPFAPREGRQYEAGLKWQPMSDSLVTVSFFDIKESNFVTQDPDFLQNFVQTGEVGSEGFEIEAYAKLFDSLDLTAAYSYTRAEVLSDNSGREGFRIEELPEHLVSAWAVKTLELGGSISARMGGGVRHVGDKIDGFQIYETDAVTLLDAFFEAEYEEWSVSINANNLLNEKYYAYCVASSAPYGACYPGMDRRVVATMRRLF